MQQQKKQQQQQQQYGSMPPGNMMNIPGQPNPSMNQARPMNGNINPMPNGVGVPVAAQSEGQGFRWSLDELRNSIWQSGNNGAAVPPPMSAASTSMGGNDDGGARPTSSTGSQSFLDWLRDSLSLRLSNTNKKRERSNDVASTGQQSASGNGTTSEAESVEARHEDRVAAMREKKKLRERERRNQLNGLYESLGDLVGYENTKNKAGLLERTKQFLEETSQYENAPDSQQSQQQNATGAKSSSSNQKQQASSASSSKRN